MLIKRSYHLEALRAVMDLMKTKPKEVYSMTPSMPPIENKSGNEIGDHTSPRWAQITLEMKYRPRRQPSLPSKTRKSHHAELDYIYDNYPKGPCLYFRQRPAWKTSLQDKTKNERQEQVRKHRVILSQELMQRVDRPKPHFNAF